MSWAPYLRPVYRWEVQYTKSNGAGTLDSTITERTELECEARFIADQHPGAIVRPIGQGAA